VCICSGPADTRSRHGIGALAINRLRRWRRRSWQPRPVRIALRLLAEPLSWGAALATMWRADALLMSGTGMLADSGEGPSGLPYEILKWSLAAWLCRRRLLFVSVGVEPMLHWLSRFFIRTSLRLAGYRSYRDAQSRALLQRIGFPAGGDAVYPDLAFSLPASLADRVVPHGPSARPTVAVGLYDYCGRGAVSAVEAQAYRGYLDKLCTLVHWLLERGYSVRIIISDLSYDEDVRLDLRAALEARGGGLAAGRVIDEPATSVDALVAQIAEAELVVATRFHHVLLALFLGKPVLSVSYNAKNDALMAEVGLAGFCQSIDGFDVERLIQQLQTLRNEWARLCEGVRARTSQSRAELERQYALIFGSTGGGATLAAAAPASREA